MTNSQWKCTNHFKAAHTRQRRGGHDPDEELEAVENCEIPLQKGLDSSREQSVNGHMPMSTYSSPQSSSAMTDPFAALTESFTPKRAVSYLRVSTREQAERGGREEGFSIPAQRDANKKKAQSMGAMVVKEFVERGVSATTTNRPELKAMLRYLEEEAGSIDYVIVHKVDRLARNRADDVELNKRFDELGIRLVSTSENIDQSPGGMLLHGIMSSIAEFYSKNLSNEVKKGMTEKVRTGGSVGRAPLGYRNIIELVEGRENRTVVIDEQRAHLITWAFKQYATDEYSVRSLTDALVKRGLTMPASAKFTERPVESRQVHQILTNPYYLGIVTYKNVQYPGKHQPLIDSDVFEKVQALLRAKINGERNITHHHYLKSTLHCDRCGFRMIVQVAKSRTGEEYPYYSCLGRHSQRNNCDMRSITFMRVEELIQELYDRLALRPSQAEAMHALLNRELRKLTKDVDEQRESLLTTKLEIERKQRKLLEAHYNDAIPLEMLRTEQQKLDQELTTVTRELAGLDTDVEQTEHFITMAIELATHSADAYRRAPDHIRRMFNQILFERINVCLDGNDDHMLEAVLAPPFDDLHSPLFLGTIKRAGGQEVEEKGSPAISGGASPYSLDFSHALVSNKSTMVGLTGFEPATP